MQTSETDNKDSLNTFDSNETSTSQQNKSHKRKKVSFKFTLETSDDLDITKTEPQPCIDPPVSIIKKECLTRAIRIARGGEPILMPSRLNGLMQKFRYNNANNIDKLNSLTFKSQFKLKEKLTFKQDNVNEKGSDDERHENGDENVETDSDADVNEDGQKESRRRRVNFGSDNEVNGSDGDDDEYREVVRRSRNHKIDRIHDDGSDDSIDAETDIKNGECDNSDEDVNSDESKRKTKKSNSNGAEMESDNRKSVTGKNSILPNQNATHSSRVIKSNKKALDESQNTNKKSNAFNLSKLNKSKSSKTETNGESSKSTTEPSSNATGMSNLLGIEISCNE